MEIVGKPFSPTDHLKICIKSRSPAKIPPKPALCFAHTVLTEHLPHHDLIRPLNSIVMADFRPIAPALQSEQSSASSGRKDHSTDTPGTSVGGTSGAGSGSGGVDGAGDGGRRGGPARGLSGDTSLRRRRLPGHVAVLACNECRRARAKVCSVDLYFILQLPSSFAPKIPHRCRSYTQHEIASRNRFTKVSLRSAMENDRKHVADVPHAASIVFTSLTPRRTKMTLSRRWKAFGRSTPVFKATILAYRRTPNISKNTAMTNPSFSISSQITGMWKRSSGDCDRAKRASLWQIGCTADRNLRNIYKQFLVHDRIFSSSYLELKTSIIVQAGLLVSILRFITGPRSRPVNFSSVISSSCISPGYILSTCYSANSTSCTATTPEMILVALVPWSMPFAQWHVICSRIQCLV